MNQKGKDLPVNRGAFIAQKYRCRRHGVFSVGVGAYRTPPPGAACPKCKEISPVVFDRSNPFRGADFMKKVERR